MFTTAMATPSVDVDGFDATTCAPIVRDREGLLAVLSVIDREGWNSQTAERLLAFIRAVVVRPNVASTGLRGPAAEQAEATAWEATWEALTMPSLRSADSPWGVLWAIARRAARGEVVAGNYCTNVHAGWRVARSDAAEGRAANPRKGDAGTFRHLPPMSLADLAQCGIDLPARSELPDLAAGPLLSLIVQALVSAGWREIPARRIVDVVAAGADRNGSDSSEVHGFRHLAEYLDMPPWQVRRVMVLMLGAPDWPGLVERLATDGGQALQDPSMLAAIDSTVSAWSRSPVTAARQAGQTDSRGRRRAA